MSQEDQPISSEPVTEVPPSQTQEPSTEVPVQRALAHPIHTLLLVALLLVNSWYGGAKTTQHQAEHGNVAQYVFTAALEVILVGYVWLGLRLRRIPFREVLGRRWKSFDDFMLDIGLAIVVWMGSIIILAGLQYAMGMMKEAGVKDKISKLQPLAPHSVKELVLFLLLAVMAGICEEIVFRGYLQKQFTAWFRNLPTGIIVSAVLFGAAHGYQGWKLMLVVAVLGAIFGVTAALRKSLIPGMMAHAWQDSIAGVGLWLMGRYPKLFQLG